MIDTVRLKTGVALAAALLLVLAGCTGGVGPNSNDAGDGATTTGGAEDVDGDAETEALDPSNADADGEAGSVTFYLSDAPIETFEHLNVTVTQVGLQRAGDGNTSNTSNASNESGGWVEYDVDDRTVDLTELQGPNATSLGVLSAPAGNYTKVFVHVSEVEGILETGEEVNVKLPSQKLQINSAFTVSANSSTSFVFDISVFEAGNSGKYILKPVVGESGTDDDVEIRDVDEEDDEGDDESEDGDENESDGSESEREADSEREIDETIHPDVTL